MYNYHKWYQSQFEKTKQSSTNLEKLNNLQNRRYKNNS